MKKIYTLLLLMSAMFFVSCNQDPFIKSVKVPVSVDTSGGTSGGTTGGTTTTLVDSISNVVITPNPASGNSTVKITFNYTTTENRDVHVAIKNPSDGWSTLVDKTESISESGTKEIEFTLSNAAAADYKVILNMWKSGENYADVNDADGNKIEVGADLTIN